MGFTLIGNNSLLPQLTLNGRSRQYTLDETGDNPFSNMGTKILYTAKTVLECSVQPLSSRSQKDFEALLSASEESFKNNEVYWLFTTTKLTVSVEGTNILSDQVKIESVTGQELWFTVLRAMNRPTTGISRYKYLVVLDTTQL